MGRVPHRESDAAMVDFVRSVAKAYNAPVWDEGHPMARVLATFRRKVGGIPVSTGEIAPPKKAQKRGMSM